jgi:hypothetical protein
VTSVTSVTLDPIEGELASHFTLCVLASLMLHFLMVYAKPQFVAIHSELGGMQRPNFGQIKRSSAKPSSEKS